MVGLGTFYTFVSWMMIAGNGKAQAIEKANTDSIGLWVDLAEDKLGGAFIGDLYLLLIVIGSFACGLAFHNAASRYLYAIGREIPATQNTLGPDPRPAPDPAHLLDGAERHHAGCSRSASTSSAVEGSDPTTGAYIFQYGLLAILGTMAILIVQAITSLAVIWYFHVKKVQPGNILTTGIIPAIGGLGMVYVVWLLLDNIEFAGGAAADSPFFKAIPWLVIGTFALGLVGVMVLRSRSPEVYRAIGRTVMEETHQREPAGGDGSAH